MKSPRRNSEKNRWVRDAVKEEYWRQQLALWQQSGLSVRAFCKEHGVVETSFYAWRRELIIRARESGSIDEVTDEQRATPNVLRDARGRVIPVRYRESDQLGMKSVLAEKENNIPFVPLKVVEETADSPPLQEFGPQTNDKNGLEILLPGGAVMRLNSGSNMHLAVELLSALKE